MVLKTVGKPKAPEEQTEFSKFTSIIVERAKSITEQKKIIAERAK